MVIKKTPYLTDVMNGKICPYCKSGTKSVSQKYIYGRSFDKKNVICCRNYPKCDSYVGTDSDGFALGRLAKKNLRKLKKEAHKDFDKLWREKHITRSKAYEELTDFLELPPEYTHIGMFGIDTCKIVIEWSIEYLDELNQ